MREARFDAGTDTELRVDLGKMERGGLDAAFFVIFVEQGPRTPEGYAAAFAAAERKVVGHRGTWSASTRTAFDSPPRPKDVVENHAAGRLSAMMGIENGFVIGKDLARLDALYARGARYLGLTHTGHNDICTSSGLLKEFGDTPAPENVGLSPFGESVVRRANALGMMVDVSHASDACVRDVLRLSAAPIIASHSSARALTNHARNLTDELMRAIAAKGGVVHIVAYTGFLKLDPARDAAEKALESEVARQAGDAEFDSAKHEYLPAYQPGARTHRQAVPAGDARRLPRSHPARRERGRHRSRRTRLGFRRRRRHPGLERCEPDAQCHGGAAPARLHGGADRAALERQPVARVARRRAGCARLQRSPAKKPSMRSSMR